MSLKMQVCTKQGLRKHINVCMCTSAQICLHVNLTFTFTFAMLRLRMVKNWEIQASQYLLGYWEQYFSDL